MHSSGGLPDGCSQYERSIAAKRRKERTARAAAGKGTNRALLPGANPLMVRSAGCALITRKLVPAHVRETARRSTSKGRATDPVRLRGVENNPVAGRLPLRAKARAKARTKRTSHADFLPMAPPRRLEPGPPLQGVTERGRVRIVLLLASHAKRTVVANLRTSGS